MVKSIKSNMFKTINFKDKDKNTNVKNDNKNMKLYTNSSSTL